MLIDFSRSTIVLSPLLPCLNCPQSTGRDASYREPGGPSIPVRRTADSPRDTLNNPSARLNVLCVELQSTDLFRPSLVLVPLLRWTLALTPSRFGQGSTCYSRAATASATVPTAVAASGERTFQLSDGLVVCGFIVEIPVGKACQLFDVLPVEWQRCHDLRAFEHSVFNYGLKHPPH